MASLSDYLQYLNYASQKGGTSVLGQDLFTYGRDDGTNQPDAILNQNYLSDPGSFGLFDFDYNPVNHPFSVNPYYNVEVRDYVRKTAKENGLSDQDADLAALAYAQQHLQGSGQPYGDADHPMVVADGILKNLFGNAGKPYQGLTPEQITHYNNVAGDFQTQLKGQKQDAENAQNLNEVMQIASVFGPAALGALGAAGSGAATGKSGADAAAGAGSLFGTASGSDALLGSGELNSLGADQLGGANPYADPNLPAGVNPGAGAGTATDFSGTPVASGVDASGAPLASAPGSTPSLPPTPPSPFPTSPDASMGSSALGTGAAAGLGAGAANNALSGSDDSGTPTGGGSGSSADGLGGILGGAGAGAGGFNLAQLLASLGVAGLGVAGSLSQADAYKDVAERYMNMGQPYRDKLQQLYTDQGVNDWLNSAAVTTPVQMGTDALARSLSVKGNPFGNGTSLQSLQDYATKQLYGDLGNERNRLANFGGLSAFNSAAPSASAAGINAGAGAYDAAGYGLAGVLNSYKPQSAFNMLGLA